MRRTILSASVLALALIGPACHSGPGGLEPADAGAPSGTGGAAGAGAGGAKVDGGAGSGPGLGRDAGTDGAPPTSDSGFIGMRRLTNVEYARTIQDLLGLGALDRQILSSFGGDSDWSGVEGDYDDVVNPGVSATHYQAYFTNAVALVEEAFASDPLRTRIVTCAPATPTDDACSATIIRAFGLRAWRRPPSDAEVADLTALVRADLTAGDDFSSAIAEAVTAMLVSDSFLYRIEFDPPPPSVGDHPLTSYELATRLSYLLWSTMPDAPLFALAASDDLRKTDVLTAQVTRMLADARSDGFVRNFLGQWLGFRDLDGAPLDRMAPAWSPALQASMFEEARLFATDLVQSDRGIGDLLTGDVNFVDANLAALYGFPAPAAAATLTRTQNTTDAREGYLGLAAWLTLTSDTAASSPAKRGKWVDEQLLCTVVPAPPASVPTLTPPATGTPRQQYDVLAAMPTCGACHKLFEPLGLGLESFDEIGKFRTSYAGATLGLIDTNGALPDGTPFQGLLGLADLLGKSPQLTTCATRQLLTYALGRTLTDADANRLATLAATWTAAGLTVRELLATIVVDDIFRTRHAEVQP